MKKQLTAAALSALIAAGALPISACAVAADDMAPVKTPALNTTDHIQYMNGYQDGTFRPDATITRAEAAKLMNAILGRETSNFVWSLREWDDVLPEAWYYLDVLAATTGEIRS